jgi:hypothetical protein
MDRLIDGHMRFRQAIESVGGLDINRLTPGA